VLDLEFGQFDVDLFLLLVGVLQQLFQLLAILDLALFNLVQTILVLGHNDVEGQFLLLSWDTNDLQLFVLVVVELALALQNLDVLGLLASQWVEFALFGLLLLTEMAAPFGVDLSSVDNDQFGVLSHSILRNSLLQFVVGLLGDVAVDLVAALLGLTLEVAFLDLSVQAGLDGLQEFLLSAVALVDDDGRGGLDFSLLVLASLLSLFLSLEALMQSGVSLLVLLLVQTSTSNALDLTLGIATSSTLNGGQSQLDGRWSNNGVLVVVFLFSLLVQLGGQVAVGFFQSLQQLVFGLALVFLLLTTFLLLVLLSLLSLLTVVAALALVQALVLVLVILILALVLILVIVLLLLAVMATLALVLVLVLVLVILILALVLVLVVELLLLAVMATLALVLVILILVTVLLVAVVFVLVIVQVQVAITLVALVALVALALLLTVLLVEVVFVIFILFI